MVADDEVLRASLSVSNSMRPEEERSVFEGNILTHFGFGLPFATKMASMSDDSRPEERRTGAIFNTLVIMINFEIRVRDVRT